MSLHPPKKGFTTYKRPAFKFAMDAIASTDSQGNQYIAPEAVSPLSPFKAGAQSVILPYLYHAGTAWALNGSLFPPSSDDDFNAGSNNGIVLGYQAMPSTRPWGRAGFLLRPPRSVIVITDTMGTGDDFVAFIGAGVGSAAVTAKASVVVCTPDQGVSCLTSWAPRNLDRSGIGAVTQGSPIAAATWQAGDLLAIVMTSNAYFGHSQIIDQASIPAFSGASWDTYSPVQHAGNDTGQAVAIDRPAIAAARSYWPTLTAQVARLGGVALYDPFTGTDKPSPGPADARNSDYYAKYDPDTLFSDVTDSLTPTWTRTSVANLRQSPTNGAAAVVAAIQSFWP